MIWRFQDSSSASRIAGSNRFGVPTEQARLTRTDHHRPLPDSIGRTRSGQSQTILADLGEGISIVAQQRNLALEGKTLDDVHREYLLSRDVSLVTAQRKNKSVEQARLSPNAKLKASTARDYVAVMARKFGDWRTRPLASITRDMVEARHLLLSGVSPAEANRAMRYLRALFVFASDYRDSKGQPVIPDNPVWRLSATRLWNRIERRTRYIEPDQLAPWWQAVQSLKDKPQYPSREVHRDYLATSRKAMFNSTWNNPVQQCRRSRTLCCSKWR